MLEQICIIHKTSIPSYVKTIEVGKGVICADCYSFEIKLTPNDEILLRKFGIKRNELINV